MKKIIPFLLFIPLFAFSQSYKKKFRVLFLGNSYTYVNNLPAMIYYIGLTNGDTMIYDSNCPGGYTLNNHFNDPTSISKISLGTWDYVVLQAQSQEPSFSPAQVGAQTSPYAVKLDSVIKKYNPCATTVFYETWGRKNGDASNCGSYPPVCTYAGMQTRLRQSYKSFADSTKGIMAPAGEAFRSSISYSPGLELYQADESHPSLTGSYIAACVLYESLFSHSVTIISNPGLAAQTCTFVQKLAHDVLRDSLEVWNLGKYLPWADFDMNVQNNPSIQFTTRSVPLNNKWYFGDGSVSTLPSPSHTYLSPGNYTVSHVVSGACKRDSVAKKVNVVSTLGLKANSEKGEIGFFPNPGSESLHFFWPKAAGRTCSIKIIDVNGSLVFNGSNAERIDISRLEKGIYFIHLNTQAVEFRSRFIKE